MVLSITAIQKRRGRPPTGITPQVNVRLPAHIVEALDKATSELAAGSRSDALRLILNDWLIGHGYLELPPEREDAN